MRLESKIVMAVQNCRAALWAVTVKEELLVLCTVRCPVPGRMERSQPSWHSYYRSAALPLQQHVREQAQEAVQVIAAVQTS